MGSAYASYPDAEFNAYNEGFSGDFDTPAQQPAPEPEKPKALTVSVAMGMAKRSLEELVVPILGEVSEVNAKAGYKAVYFTVKDADASLPCMMWLNRYRASGLELRVGMLVQITGRFTLYAKKGRMSFDVFDVKLAGEGDLRMRVAALARKLQAEGLTAPERKRPVPALPATIGLVTSPRGAAVHDVLRTLRRRFPLARVLLAGVPVEGDKAPEGLIAGLHTVANAGAEVILLVRGGGSFEDLMPFNDESLAREIAACPVPVVTGIGHEPDTSIADMVADLRASTPTAAAEAVSPGMDALRARLDQQAARMTNPFVNRLQRSELVLKRYSDKPIMKDPHALMASWEMEIDAQTARLSAALPAQVERDRNRVDALRQRLALRLPSRVQAESQALEMSTQRFMHVLPQACERARQDLSLAASRLNDLSPLAVLSRGYSIARDPKGDVVKSVDQVSPGQNVTVTVSDGVIRAQVESVTRNEQA